VLLTAVSQSAQIGESPFGLIGLARNVLVNQWFLGDTPTIYLSGDGSIGDGRGGTMWQPAAVLLAAGCWLIIAFALVRRSPDEPRTTPSYRTLLACWIVVPSTILVGYAMLGAPLYNPRYLTFGAPAVAALLGIGLIKLRQLPGRLGWSAYVAAALIVLLALPIFVSQRGVHAKSGADWKPIAEFVMAHPGPNQAAYFAPRVPPTSDVVTITSRTAKTLYPGVFDPLRDLTLVSSAAEDANLLGRSQPLAASVDRLTGIETVFVINRLDYPADLVAADEAVLTAAGFQPGDRWAGPLNTVVEYRR
jgi:mannosyltransferase